MYSAPVEVRYHTVQVDFIGVRNPVYRIVLLTQIYLYVH